MGHAEVFKLRTVSAIEPLNAGLGISRGVGIHPDRVIDSHELIFVRKGELEMEENGHSFLIRPSQALILHAGRRHRGTKVFTKGLSFFWIHFRIRPETRKAAAPGRQLDETISIPQVATVRRDDRLSELFRRYLDDQESGELKPGPAAMLIALMLYEVAASRGEGGASTSVSVALAARANTLIKTRFHLPLSTTGIAAELECNTDYLGRVYQRAFGSTIIDAIHQERLRSARKLLLESSHNINQIAHQCGFSSSVYFCRIFRRAQGISPLAYRRLHARLYINTD